MFSNVFSKAPELGKSRGVDWQEKTTASKNPLCLGGEGEEPGALLAWVQLIFRIHIDTATVPQIHGKINFGLAAGTQPGAGRSAS